MERFDIDYLKKNMPLPTKREYKIQSIAKAESVIKRMRWRSLEFFNKLSSSEMETYGFPSNKCPSTVDELSAFESDLLMMIKNIEFRKSKDVLQLKLQEDIKIVKQLKNLFISADKSTNIYAMEKDDYNRYLRDNITRTYKKTDRRIVKSINYQAKKIVEKTIN